MNDITVENLMAHLRARRNYLDSELRDAQRRVNELHGAIEETRILEQQVTSGMVAKSRLTCE